VPLEKLVFKGKSVPLATQEPWVAQVQKVLLETQEQLEIPVLKVKWVQLVTQEPWVAQEPWAVQVQLEALGPLEILVLKEM
jgi:hypothetical protein